MFLAKTGRTLVNQMSTYTTRQSSRDPSTMAKVALVLEDGSVFFGKSFGAPIKEKSLGEAVFQTGMVGYAEALTDPSYRGQLLAMTFPMIGNYGVPAYAEDENGLPVKTFESKHIHASALIVQEYSAVYSHWEANRSLGEWLAEENVPGICEVDTRRLAKLLRERGSMLGAIVPHAESETALKKLAPQLAKEAKEYLATRHLVDEVSCTDSPRIYKPTNTQEKARVLAIDCGIKANMVRELNKRGVQVTVLRWNEAWATNGLMDQYDGVFLSNGPGDPTACDATIAQIKSALSRADPTTVRPIFGICLGNQLVGLAAGAETKKLRFGNRGQNQPCIDAKNGECFVTSQNHGYAVDDTKLPTGWSTLYTNANDGSNEGLIHDSLPYFTAQFHPEANGGPNDAAFLFDVFVDACINYRQVRQGIIMETKFPALRFENSLHAVQPMKQSHEFPKKVLLLGSGGLSIGQAGEFDYSGAQAIKALKEEGVEVVLMNPNIASVQTNVDPSSTAAQRRADPSAADHVFFIPVTPAFVEQVIIREKPDAILISMGGQTALNCGIELHNKGIFAKYGVRVLGTQIDAVVATEDREIFKNELAKIGEPVATSVAVTSVKDALEAAENVTGYPCMARAAFALGGLGSGIVQDAEQLEKLARKALAVSPQLLIEKSMLGWKEVEYEVVRDSADNCITVCNMENFDPLGVHTGDSIVVAPSQTLTNREYFKLRATALKVVRHLGIIGECNIQYALNPKSEDACIIEVNARLSRSSALASKATGFPLAYVATKLSLGHDLVSIRNSVTQTTTACFEPSLDYCVVKVPRWDMRKFQRVSTRLGSAMKSVGEVMAIGRSFEEAIQKAVRMVNPNLPGLEGFAASGNEFDNNDDDHLSGAQSSSGISIQGLEQRLKQPNDQRLFAVQLAFEKGYSIDKVHELTKIDRWFLAKLRRIARLRVAVETRFAQQVTENHNTLMRSSVGSGGISASIEALGYDAMRKLKQAGFSDAQIASYARCTEARVRRARLALGVKPAVKQIDTLGGEVPARTNYLYMTYHGDEADVVQSERAVIVLGCGAYCIGSSVEFDWSAVSCVRQCRASGYRAIVVNCNPETVSTDYDVSDRLYFEELSLERVLDIYEQESAWGLVVSVGGQIPNNLAKPLHDCGVHILGTSPQDIERAEDRHKFSAMLDEIGVDQPPWRELQSTADAISFAERVGYPVLVRPSFVLSGAAMNVASSAAELTSFLNEASDVSPDHPVVVSKFIQNAKEIEFDAVASDGHILNYAISEHVENAGVHSGDATLVLPAQKLYVQTQKQVKRIASKIAKHLRISGPFNIQLMARENDVKVIECNLRASRSFPFLSKTLNCNFISLATRVMLGVPARPYSISMMEIDYVCVKAPMFSFTRLRGADPILGVEMASTGEVACLGVDVYGAYLKALESTGMQLPSSSDKKAGKKFFLSISNAHDHAELAKKIAVDLGFHIVASPGTAKALISLGIPNVQSILSSTQEETALSSPRARPAWADATIAQLEQGNIAFVINIPSSAKLSSFCDDQESVTNGYLVRRAAIDFGVGLILNEKSAHLFVEALVRSLNDPVLRTTPFHVDEFYSGAYHDYNQL
mmetsp:Transcript_16398/g.24617  ORF Transcript_16398/g.24617 Transcript_16398/m.24617 type:complete len:1604 (-) Transcript_16398:380-5191(-)